MKARDPIRLPASRALDRAGVKAPATPLGTVRIQGPHEKTGEWRVIVGLGQDVAAVILTPDEDTAKRIGDAFLAVIRALRPGAAASGPKNRSDRDRRLGDRAPLVAGMKREIEWERMGKPFMPTAQAHAFQGPTARISICGMAHRPQSTKLRYLPAYCCRRCLIVLQTPHRRLG